MLKITQSILRQQQATTKFQMGSLSLPEFLNFWELPFLKCIIHPIEILPKRRYNEIL